MQEGGVGTRVYVGELGSSMSSRGGERGVAVAHSLITSSNNKYLTCNGRKKEGGSVSGRKLTDSI